MEIESLIAEIEFSAGDRGHSKVTTRQHALKSVECYGCQCLMHHLGDTSMMYAQSLSNYALADMVSIALEY